MAPEVRVPINQRDWTALVPDGPVNRHAPATLYADADGVVHVEYQLEFAREHAKDAKGRLPEEQLISAQGVSSEELDALRDQLREARAEIERLSASAAPAGGTEGGV